MNTCQTWEWGALGQTTVHMGPHGEQRQLWGRVLETHTSLGDLRLRRPPPSSHAATGMKMLLLAAATCFVALP